MKTILIIENNENDANKIKESLIKIYHVDLDKFQIIIFIDDNYNNFQKFYDSDIFMNKLSEKIKQLEIENKPLVSIVLDIFLTTNEEKTLFNGCNYLVTTSNMILEKYGDIENNGNLDGKNMKFNIFLLSRFPQYCYYAETLHNNEDWGIYFYENKRDFFENSSEPPEMIKKILIGEKDK